MSTSKMKALVQVKHRIRQRLDEVCGVGASGMGLNCNVEDLEAICREVRTEMMLETNEILKRRRKRGEVKAVHKNLEIPIRIRLIYYPKTLYPQDRLVGGRGTVATDQCKHTGFEAGILPARQVAIFCHIILPEFELFPTGQILFFQPNATYGRMSEVSAFDLAPVVRDGKRQVISVRFKLIGEWKDRRTEGREEGGMRKTF